MSKASPPESVDNLDIRVFVKVLLRPKMHLSFSPQMLKVLTLSNKFAKS